MSKFIIEYGVLRTDEWRTIIIKDNDEHNELNYFNITSKKLIIQEHKNSKYTPIRIINIANDFIDLIKHRVNKYFLTNTKDNGIYSNAQKFNDNVSKKWFNYTINEMRHIKTATMINMKYEEEIDLFEPDADQRKRAKVKNELENMIHSDPENAAKLIRSWLVDE